MCVYNVFIECICGMDEFGHWSYAYTQQSFKVNQREKDRFPLFESAFLVHTLHIHSVLLLH